MRVLHVVPSYLPAKRYGGPVFATHALCAALAASGCRVTVFTTCVDGDGESNVPTEKAVDVDGVEVWYFPSPILRRLFYSPAMGRALKSRCREFDLLHLHSVYLWPTSAAAMYARKLAIPYLISPRGMLVQDLINRKNRWLKTAWIHLLERRNLENAAGVHVTSSLEAAEIQRFGFKLPPLYEVPNGVGWEQEATTTMPRLASDLLARGRPVVLYMGRINWKKGIDRLLAAMERVPGAELLIAGNDEERYMEALTRMARRHGVGERVTFCGPVYGSAKAQLYRSAAVLVLPSYSENFGNVVLEAMFEGCPVVVTREVGAAPIVEQSGGGVVSKGDAESLSYTINHLIHDPRMRAEMGRKGREAMRARYSWTSVASRMAQVYSLLCDRSVAGQP